MLSARQRSLYRDRVNLYRAKPLEEWGSGMVRDLAWDPTPVYSNVPCYWEVKQDTTGANSPIGRTPEDNIFTQDLFHFGWEVETSPGVWAPLVFGGQWVIEIVTPGHLEAGAYFVLTGETTKLQVSRSQFAMAKKAPKPAGLV
jgi:hypothetical protein